MRGWSTGATSSVTAASTDQNLIQNGDFSQATGDSWKQYNEAPGVENGTVSIIERDGRRVAHFNRQGEEGVHTEVGIFQEINKDVNVYDSLTIQLDVRLLYQSLAGAGYMNSEFPLRVEIAYTDVYGKDLRWGHGFYYRDPDDPARVINNASKIPPYNWYTFQSPNLMELLAETRPGADQQHSHLCQRAQLSEHGERNLHAGRVACADGRSCPLVLNAGVAPSLLASALAWRCAAPLLCSHPLSIGPARPPLRRSQRSRRQRNGVADGRARDSLPRRNDHACRQRSSR